MISITPIPAFTDNYIWCIHDEKTAVVVDPGDAQPVFKYLNENKLTLSAILITHHHYDHTGGVNALLEIYPTVDVAGPDNPKISEIKTALREGDSYAILDEQFHFKILDVPGHTLDHIAFYDDEHLFCGDALFSAGCGRMFEGTPEMFWASLKKLKALPANTKVFCTHEYTSANVQFARYIDPDNQSLAEYEAWLQKQRADDKVTLPSSIERENEINPFLQCDNRRFAQSLQSRLELDSTNEVQVFAAIRKAKDNF